MKTWHSKKTGRKNKTGKMKIVSEGTAEEKKEKREKMGIKKQLTDLNKRNRVNANSISELSLGPVVIDTTKDCNYLTLHIDTHTHRERDAMISITN